MSKPKMTLLKDEETPGHQQSRKEASAPDGCIEDKSPGSTGDSATPDNSIEDGDTGGAHPSPVPSKPSNGSSIVHLNDESDSDSADHSSGTLEKGATIHRMLPGRSREDAPKPGPAQTELPKVNGQSKSEPHSKSTDTSSNAETTCNTGVHPAQNSGRSRRRSRAAWKAMEFPEGLEMVFKNDSDSDANRHRPFTARRRDQAFSWARYVVSKVKPEDMLDDSPSRKEWLRQKEENKETNVHLDQLMSMIGLEEVKAHFLAVKARVKAAKASNTHDKLKLHLVLVGKNGTGKRSIAQIYARFLESIGAVSKQSLLRASHPVRRLPQNQNVYTTSTPRTCAVVFYDLTGRSNPAPSPDSDTDSDSSSSTSIVSDSPRPAGVVPPRTGMPVGGGPATGFPRPGPRPGVRPGIPGGHPPGIVPGFRPGGPGAPPPAMGPSHRPAGPVVGFPLFVSVPLSDREYLLKTAKNSIIILSARTHAQVESVLGSVEALREFQAPITLPDYTADELRQIFLRMMQKQSCLPESGSADWSLQVLAQRVAQERDSASFANVHCLEEELKAACKRRGVRQQKAYTQWFAEGCARGSSPSSVTEEAATETAASIHVQNTPFHRYNPPSMALKAEDLLGSSPDDIRATNVSWKKLQDMIGLEKIKKECGDMIDMAQLNYRRELLGMKPVKVSLNRVFLGPSGAGKTKVAELYAQLLIDMKMVSGSEVMIRNPAHLIGGYFGHSELQTKAILDQSRGKVLIIDDFHMLGRGDNSTVTKSDAFRSAVIDTIVANVSADPEDRSIIIVGYDEEMEQLFNNNNPGLRRRFPKETTLHFGSYSEDELCQIMDMKAAESGLEMTKDARVVARQSLNRMRMNPKFGNAGDVSILIDQAKMRMSARALSILSKNKQSQRILLEREDIDPDWDRRTQAEERRAALFENFVGFDSIVKKFQHYQLLADGLRTRGIDPKPHLPWAFIFKGPPGTGKTSTARKVGQLYYDMGLLSTNEVVTCTVTDLVAEIMGGTGPKVRNILETGLGKVLFIDEAYRLALGTSLRDNSFHMEAVCEIVDSMTKPRYQNNIVIILAGYTNEMDHLLQINPGLRGRFPEHIVFPPMTPRSSYKYLKEELGRLGISVPDDNDPDDPQLQRVYQLFVDLSHTRGWASGRDVETLAKTIVGKVYVEQGRSEENDKKGSLRVEIDELIGFLQNMRDQRGNFPKVTDDLYE